MDARSDQFATHSHTGLSASSTQSPQLWMNHAFSLSSGSRSRRFDRPLDEPTLAQRRAVLRQPSRVPRQSQRIHRQTTSIGSRSSLPSQPVVARTISAEPDNARGTMSSQPSRPGKLPPARLPPVQDFGIEGILRAIDPNIQTTLDNIAEICGRSKLSLANEYGSHRPPLGEIRAPSRPTDHVLLAVEEVSSSTERLANDNVFVVGDDMSTVDGRDPYLRYRFPENAQPNTGELGHRAPFPLWNESMALPSSSRVDSTGAAEPQAQRKVDKSEKMARPSSWALLNRGTVSDAHEKRRSIQTQPITSEVLLDAQASGTGTRLESTDNTQNDTQPSKHSTEKHAFFTDIHNCFSWLRSSQQGNGPRSRDNRESAERKLREVLRRQDTVVAPAGDWQNRT